MRNLSVLLLCSLLFPTLSTISAETNGTSGLFRCTTPVPRDGKAHDRFLLLNQRAKEADKEARIIFVGDSITEGWEVNGREAWKKYYEPRGALNLGIGSDHTQHVLWRLESGNIDGLAPSLAVVLIGVNNVPHEENAPGDILAGVTAVAEKLHSKLPETKVLMLGIFPFREIFNPQRGKALQINQALQKWCENKSEWVQYMDLGHLFINEDGRIPREMMRDFLHPSPAAYSMWAEAMEPTIRDLLGNR